MTTQVRPTQRRRASDPRLVLDMFESLELSDSECERQHILGSIVELHLELAYGEAARYRNRGIALDDLRPPRRIQELQSVTGPRRRTTGSRVAVRDLAGRADSVREATRDQSL